MKTMIEIACADCGKVRFMTLGDFNRGRRKTSKCLPCYNRHPNHYRGEDGGHKNIIHEGYVNIYLPSHHRATNRGYVKRAVVMLERKLGRELEPGEHSHHINGLKDDDRPENLEATSNSEHQKLHATQRTYRRTEQGKFACQPPSENAKV